MDVFALFKQSFLRQILNFSPLQKAGSALPRDAINHKKYRAEF